MVEEMNPIDEHLYKERKDFCIVALTGVLGSGFDSLTEVMTNQNSLLGSVRAPQEINVPFCVNNGDSAEENKEVLSKLLFRRKYTICYNYIKNNYGEYTILKYNKVLWLYTLRFLAAQVSNDLQKEATQKGGEVLCQKVKTLLDDKYTPYNFEDNTDNANSTFNRYKIENITPSADILGGLNIDWEALYNQIVALPDFTRDSISGDKNVEIADVFFGNSGAFYSFYDNIRNAMLSEDFYLYCMFYWRLGICIRAKKDPTLSFGTTKEEERIITNYNDGLFEIVHLITSIIKGYHKSQKLHDVNKGTRICIDSLRNSFEARYLQERFSAFYLINVYNSNVRETLNNLVESHKGKKSEERRKLIRESIYQLYKKEATSEVDDGRLAMHDVDTCVSNAEIHITNRANGDANDSYKETHFYSIAEQWMKFAALIQRPGLFTPDTEERCMQIAYTAKFNSGCISRQVGAVITNKDGSIRTIGWNDPPQGQVPCGLRDTADLLQITTTNFTPASKEQVSMMYSEFETGGKYDNQKQDFIEVEDYKLYKGLCFKDKLPFKEIDKFKRENESLHLPYCFKQCHTTWHAKDSGNQFHQRAIHAEENAMMQMVKYGGEALKGGVIYVTASPCEICSKKLYQIGVRKIIYIDPYPGIAPWQVIRSGLLRPELECYEGVYGASYFKLYSHFIDYKNELKVRGATFAINQESKFDKKQMLECVDHSDLLCTLRRGEEYPCEVVYDNMPCSAVAKLHNNEICFEIENYPLTLDVKSVNGKKYDKDVMTKIWKLLNIDRDSE